MGDIPDWSASTGSGKSRMVRRRGVVDDAGMTDSNAEPASAPPASTVGTPRLRRRATDRVAAGVASGLADYLNVDPLLIRVALVGLVLFNGAGFFIYFAAWLFIPVEGSDTSIVEGWIRRLGASAGTAGTITWVVLAIIGTMLLLDAMRPEGGMMTVRPMVGFAIALLVIAGGILLVRRSASAGPSGVTDAPVAGESAGAADAPPAPATVARGPRVKRDPSPLGYYVVGLLLLTIGVMTALDGATAADILPGQYAGVALGILGAGLIAAAWWGRARWLILLGLLLIPPAIALGFVEVPMDGRWGEYREAPTSASELRGEYQVSAGRLELDLRELPPSTDDRHVAASIGIGRLVVILPEGAAAEISTQVGAGQSNLLGARQEGTGLADEDSSPGTGGAFVLDLQAGIGSVLVRTVSTGE
jgi:phage shock protein PspC (stress-responsive transcriptional regulator)